MTDFSLCTYNSSQQPPIDYSYLDMGGELGFQLGTYVGLSIGAMSLRYTEKGDVFDQAGLSLGKYVILPIICVTAATTITTGVGKLIGGIFDLLRYIPNLPQTIVCTDLAGYEFQEIEKSADLCEYDSSLPMDHYYQKRLSAVGMWTGAVMGVLAIPYVITHTSFSRIQSDSRLAFKILTSATAPSVVLAAIGGIFGYAIGSARDQIESLMKSFFCIDLAINHPAQDNA